MSIGGYREGAGRPVGSSNKCITEQSKRLSELARVYTEEALETLFDVARRGCTDAAYSLLDLAYGKLAVKEECEILASTPVVIQLTGSSD